MDDTRERFLQAIVGRLGAERIVELTELLHDRRRMRFSELFLRGSDGRAIEATRLELVVTFLALLEMCRMRVVRVAQEETLGELSVEFSAKRLEGDAEPTAHEAAQLEDEDAMQADEDRQDEGHDETR